MILTEAPTKPFLMRPLCTNCCAKMRLVSIEPEKPNYDRRTFECRQCSRSHSIIVKYK